MSRRMDTVRWAACALEFFVLYLLGVTPNLLPAVAGVLPVPLAAAAIAAASASGLGLSATRLSVVRTQAAMDAAFSREERVTLVGSTIPLCRLPSARSLRTPA